MSQKYDPYTEVVLNYQKNMSIIKEKKFTPVLQLLYFIEDIEHYPWDGVQTIRNSLPRDRPNLKKETSFSLRNRFCD